MNRDKLCTYPSWEALMKYWNTQIVTDHLYTTDESGVGFFSKQCPVVIALLYGRVNRVYYILDT